jgi:hypothetical protein
MKPLFLPKREIHWHGIHPEKIDRHYLSANPNAFHMLFRLDYPRMRAQNQSFRDE